MELIPFSQIDPDDSQWSEAQVEAAEFLHKMDWEGGMDGLIGYGGAAYFPEEIRHLAEAYEYAHDQLRDAIDAWAAERGVVY